MISTIPTTYNGVQYRSRLEARWAVFFDELGIRHYYEHEGFDMDGRWYVPDFYLPDVGDGIWAEVKPEKENCDRKIFALCEFVKKHCILLKGPPKSDWENCFEVRLWAGEQSWPDDGYGFAFDPINKKHDLVFCGKWERAIPASDRHLINDDVRQKVQDFRRRADAAAQKAGRYRFH